MAAHHRTTTPTDGGYDTGVTWTGPAGRPGWVECPQGHPGGTACPENDGEVTFHGEVHHGRRDHGRRLVVDGRPVPAADPHVIDEVDTTRPGTYEVTDQWDDAWVHLDVIREITPESP